MLKLGELNITYNNNVQEILKIGGLDIIHIPEVLKDGQIMNQSYNEEQ